MTNDLISRSELLLEMAAGCVPLDVKGISGVTGDESTIYDYIKNAPSVDAVPVVHGRWELYGADKRGRGGVFLCTACSRCRPTKSEYCPNCGAKMYGGDNT